LKSKLQLNHGDTLKLISHRSKGSLAETDIYTYSIINQSGEEIGIVEHTDHTSIKGFKRTQTLVQKNKSGKVIIDECW
jgi:hypothetical protein